MTRKQRKAQDFAVEMTTERIDREDAIGFFRFKVRGLGFLTVLS